MFRRWQKALDNFLSFEMYALLLLLTLGSSCPSLFLKGRQAQAMLVAMLPFQLLILSIVVLFVGLSIRNIRMVPQGVLVLSPFLILLLVNLIRLSASPG
jgi:hypothetical protein